MTGVKRTSEALGGSSPVVDTPVARTPAVRSNATKPSVSDSVEGGKVTPEQRWTAETAQLVRDHRCSAEELGALVRAREAEFRQGKSEPAQFPLARVMRAIGGASVSLERGAAVLAGYLAGERGTFTPAQMMRCLKSLDENVKTADLSGSFDQFIVHATANHQHHKDRYFWVAAAIRIWLDVPQKLDEVVHEHDG